MSDLGPACHAFQEHVLQETNTILSEAQKQLVRSTFQKYPSDLLLATALLLADDDITVCNTICAYFRPFLLELCAHLLQIEIKDANELLSQTFARVLNVTTRVWPLVKPWLESSKCFFYQLSSMSTTRKRRAAMTARLFLQIKPIECKAMWNWTSFFALCTSTDTRTQEHARVAAAVLVHMDNKTRNAFLSHEETEATPKLPELPSTWSHTHTHEFASLPPTVCNVCGIIVPYTITSGSAGPVYPPLVETTSTVQALRSLAIALSVDRPILVTGTDGCGKTALLRDLARRTGHTNMVELHLDDQMDSKTLVGSYVCTDIPGEFSWQPGALTQAVTEGRWVVIEDIDRASMDVLAALLPLLTTNELMVRGQTITASPGFQLLATSRKPVSAMPKGFPLSLWHHIQLSPLSMEEIELVLLNGYPQFSRAVVAQMLETFRVVSEESSRSIRQSYGRQFSLRDMLKWCSRLQAFVGPIDAEQYLTQDRRQAILREAWDIFCMGIRDPAQRVQAAGVVAALWQVPNEIVEQQLQHNRPVFTSQSKEVQVGRVHLATMDNTSATGHQIPFVLTGHSLRLMEQLAATIATHEPTLLVGETGCGKTTLIQYLASSLGQTLVVQNLNVQSDSADLLGGYKPVDMYQLARPLYLEFVSLFSGTFPSSSNEAFLQAVQKAFDAKGFKKMSQGMLKAVKMAEAQTKKQKPATGVAKWTAFESELERFIRQLQLVESSFAFSFVEGQLVQAMKAGHWILLDEINLASADTLERLSSVLEGEHSGLSLTEKGDVDLLKPHPNFRVFAAMNPPTDVGKKDLPPSLRNRFTQIYVDECVSPRDLTLIVSNQWKEIANAPVTDAVEFYLDSRQQAIDVLNDGARQRPRYSLRTLSRSLLMTKTMLQKGYSLPRALYESFSMGFATQLDAPSRVIMMKSIRKAFAPNLKQKELDHPPPKPRKSSETFELISSYWVPRGELEPVDQAQPDPVTNLKKFVLTPSVELNLRHIARSVIIGKYPLLLQGPTSAGKTSLILYVASRLGQKCVRINNHEHTDIQEYLGSYISGKDGKLTFQEGVLVQAVRYGWWIILDELNLAPSEVLEALNRLLDDNRELFIPETQTTIQPHTRFMLFATQNPPGLYGGRKVLSRAFRNRFVELQVDEVPPKELQQILQERSALPPSYCTLLINIMLDLQRIRAQSSVFAGKAGFITTRDLLRWAQRQPTTKQKVAEEGYFLLAERLRKEEDKLVVQQVLEKHCGATIDLDALYNGKADTTKIIGQDAPNLVWGTPEQFSQVQAKLLSTDAKGNNSGLSSISITSSLRRLFALVGRCLQHQEPVLLVGDTGAGKTTVCQLYSLLFDQELHILNCHQHTETADFLGTLRPVRGKDSVLKQVATNLQLFVTLASEINLDTSSLDGIDTTNVLQLFPALEPLVAKALLVVENQPLLEVAHKLQDLKTKAVALFEWVDGPLVTSMKAGDLLLIDEINLADDAVLERLNSVLEPARGLVLAEKGDDAEHITAHHAWRILATMNPGGDFGKRELSPALRNRFTEIWVPSLSSAEDLAVVVHDRLPSKSAHLAPSVLQFIHSFNNAFTSNGWKVTLRDLLSWLNFMRVSDLAPPMAYIQGAALSILDGLGLGSTQSLHAANTARDIAYRLLLEALPPPVPDVLPSMTWETHGEMCGVSPFYIPKGPHSPVPLPFSLAAPTTMKNLQRVLRALQVPRPILLEGSPGVGKTSLIHALAQLSGNTLVRINLSEQTDVADLFGSDLPSTDSNAASPFTWCDGVFLRALKAGQWVLLDELNLASQSVLEGLNACLDHRGTIYIPEIDKSFHCPSTFRVFAAQNPLRQGGGRKGLPKSFLNRFTRVVVDTLANDDLNIIATALYPSIPASTIEKMIHFNALVHQDTMVHGIYGRQGAPWEFNLRDVFRWCTLVSTLPTPRVTWYIPMLYTARFRTVQDRTNLARRWNEVFGNTEDEVPSPVFHISPETLQVGMAMLPRASFFEPSNQLPPLLTHWLEPMEGLMHCVRLQWPALLVGPSGSGKSAIVKLLAAMTGHRLHELGLSSGTDATELLGCFEQVDVQRRVQEVERELGQSVQRLQQHCLVYNRMDMVTQLANAEYAVAQRQRKRRSHRTDLDPMIVTLLQQLLKQVIEIQNVLSLEVISAESIKTKLDSIQLLSTTQGRSSCFEWVDGTLLQALEAGEWLLLDNVNFCSASVLDRLNSLLEINGELLVNECGVVNGTLRVVKPHPDFRIFLAMDAQFGEVSRAMRNRCIEIALLPPNAITSKSNLDMMTLMQSASAMHIPLNVYTQIESFHEDMMQQDKTISWRHIYNWSQLSQAYVDHGLTLHNACHLAISDIYGVSIDLTWQKHSQYAPPAVSTDLLVRNASLGMMTLQSRFLCYLAAKPPSQEIFALTELLCGTAIKPWPTSLLLATSESWEQCAKHLNEDDPQNDLSKAMLPWAVYRSGQHNGFSTSVTQSDFAIWLRDDQILQSAWSTLVNLLKTLKVSLNLEDVSWIYGNRPAYEYMRATVSLTNDEKVKHTWTQVEAVTQTLNMMESLWWSRFKEQSLLGIQSQPAQRHKKTKRELKQKKQTTLLDQSYQCFLHGSEAVDVENDVVPIVFPFLSALDTCVFEYIQMTMHHSLLAEQVATVQSVLHLRYAFGDIFSCEKASSFPWHRFLVGWKWLLKSWHAFHKICLFDHDETTSVRQVYDMIERMEFAITSCIGCARAKDTLWKKGGHRQLPPSLASWNAISAVESLSSASSVVPAPAHGNQLSLLDLICANNSVFRFEPAPALSLPHSYRQELLHALATYAWFIETPGQSFETLKQLPDGLKTQRNQLESKFVSTNSHILVHLQPQEDDEVHNQEATVLLLSDDDNPVIQSWIQLQLTPLREFHLLGLELQLVNSMAKLLTVATDEEFITQVKGLLIQLDSFLQLQNKVQTRSPITLVPYQDLLWRGHKYFDQEVELNSNDHKEYQNIISKHMNSAMVYFHERLWNSSVNSLDQLSSRVYHTESDAIELPKINGFVRLFQAVETTLATHFLQTSSQMPIVDVTVNTQKLKQAISHWSNVHSQPELFITGDEYVWSLIFATLRVFMPSSHEIFNILTLLHQAHDISLIDSVTQHLQSSTDARFIQSIPTFITFLTLYCKYQGKKLVQLGMSWTLIGLWRFRLLTPSSPLDPALVPLIKREFLLGRLSQWSLQDTVDECISNLSPQDVATRDHLTLVSKIEALQLKAIERPTQMFGDVFQDIVRFASSIMTNKIVDWCENFMENPNQLLREIKMFQQTTDSFVLRLQNKYNDYRDVIEPIVASSYFTKDGLSLLMHVLETETTQDVPSLARTFMSVPSPESHHDTADIILRHISTLNQHHVSSVDRLATALSQVEAHYRNQATLSGDNHQNFLETAHSIFDGFLQLWSENQEKIEKEKADAEALFKFKTRTVEIETEEHMLEKEYRNQFPDFAKAFSDIIGSDSIDTSSDDKDESPSPLPDHVVQFVAECHERLFLQAWVKGATLKDAWSKKYSLGFNFKPTLNELLDVKLDEEVRGGHILYSSHILQDQSAGETVPFSQLNAAYVANIDFHRDPHVKEVNLVQKPLQRFMLRLQTLIIQWPENAILQKLLLLSNRLRQMSNQIPLAQVLVGVELLLKHAQDWQAIASKEVSIQEEISALSALVVRWRKLELYSWPQFMVLKEKKFQLEARKAWFHLYGLLTAKPENEIVGASNLNWMLEHTPLESDWMESWRFKLFDTMEGFLRSCTMGQFQTRLVLIYSFCCQLIEFSRLQYNSETFRLACMMYHLYRYYAQHLTYNLQPMWMRLREPIQKQLNDFVKISKWDEQTYYSLAASAEKSHRKLMKFMRDYEEILSMPMQTFLDKVIDGNITSEKYDGLQALQSTWIEMKNRQDPIEDNDEEDEEIAIWRVVEIPSVDKNAATEIPVYLKEIPGHDSLRWLIQLPSLGRKIYKYTTQELMSDAVLRLNQHGRHLSEELCSAVLQRIESLKSESAPKGAKKKALIDLLSEMKNQGWSTLKSKTPPQQAHIQSLMELDIPRVESTLRLQSTLQQSKHEDPLPIWSQADSYYYRYLAQLQTLRFTIISGYNKDISFSEVDKMSGYAENMLHRMLQQRATLQTMASTHENLLLHMQILSQEPLPSIHSQESLKVWRDEQHEDLLLLLQWIEELSMISPQNKVLEFCKSLTVQCGNEWKKSQLPEDPGVPKLPLDDGNFDSSTSYGFQNKSPKLAVGFSPQVLSRDVQTINMNPLIANATQIKAICEQLRDVLTDLSLRSIDVPLTGLEKRNLDRLAESERADLTNDEVYTEEQKAFMGSFALKLNTVLEGLLISIQNACEIVAKREDDAVPTMQGCHEQLLQLVHASRIHVLPTQMDELWLMLKREIRPTWSHIYSNCVSLIQSLLPSWKLLVSWHHQLMCDFIYVHKSMAKFEYVVIRLFRTLLSNGFCKAPEENEETDSGGNMNFEDDVEGTGMGEGDGKKDVSDQIEDEEQLLGLKGDEPQEPQEKKNDEDKDKGLEMQNDFDGTMEDVPDDEEQDENDDNDDQEELDREMGEFDDDNIVDEKRWGENSDDDEDNIDKEKEKFDDQSKMDEGEALEDEVRGKDGDEEEKEKEEKKESKDTEPPEQSPDDSPQEDVTDDNKPEEDGVNEDTEDKYEEDHEDLAPRDALPDDEQKQEDEFADDMNLDGEDKEDGDDEDIDENMPDEEDLDNDENGEASADPEEQADDEEKEQDEPEVVPLGAGNEDQEVDIPSNEDPEKDKTEDQPPPPEPSEQKEESKNAGAVAGLESKDGQDAMEHQDRDETNEDDDMDQAEQEQDDSTAQEQQGGQANPNGSELKPVVGAQSQEEQNRERKEPNPYQNPEKAQEHWRRRMEILDSNQTQDKTEIEPSNDKPDDEQGGVGELAEPDDSNADLALAPTDESTVPDAMMDEEEHPSPDDEETKEPEENKNKAEPQDNEKPKEKAAPQDLNEALPSNKHKNDGVDADVDMEVADPDDSPETEEKEDVEMVINDDFTPIVASGVRDDISAEEVDTEVDIDALRAELDASMQNQTVGSIEAGTALWSTYDQITRAGAQRLCEQLRLVLAPMLRSRLQGDYRTGKRINMRKVIPYIASSFRKDKIWLRRTKPSKRAYQVMVAIDDSESMADNHAGRLALEALTTLCKGMTQLEVGEIAVVKFGEKVHLLHPFDMPFTDDAGARVINAFHFQETKTHMVETLEAIQSLLDHAKQNASNHSQSDITQIVFLISDGRFDKDGRTKMQKLVQKAMEQQQLIVLLIVDHPKDGQGICDTQSVSFVKGKVEMTPYMDNFPFPYYVIMKNTNLLPETLCNALRQWFELLQGTD